MVPRPLAPALIVCLLLAGGPLPAQEDRRQAGAPAASAPLPASPLVHRESFGRSEEGRELTLLVIADPPVTTPAEARKRGRPVVLVQAALHAGEADGMDAVLMLARRMTDGDLKPLTRQLVVLIVPVGNPDGIERWVGHDPSEQDSRSGSAEGRANARGLDLDRDYMKLETLETRALAGLLTAWDPHLVVDLHTTASAQGPLLTYAPTQSPNADARLVEFARDTLLAGVGKALLDTRGYRSEPDDVTPASGDVRLAAHVDHRPRASHNYAGLRNRIAFSADVSEHLDPQTRVAVTSAFVEEVWRAAARHALRILSLTAQADRTLTVRTRASKPLDLGLEFAIQPPGAIAPAQPIGRLAAARSRALPTAWIIPRGLAASPRMSAALERLRWHGIETETLDAATQLDVDRFVVQAVVHSDGMVEGHHEARLVVTMEKAALSVDPGSVLIRANQRLARLAFYLLEPDTDDGLVTWNIIGEGLTVGQGFPVYRVR